MRNSKVRKGKGGQRPIGTSALAMSFVPLRPNSSDNKLKILPSKPEAQYVLGVDKCNI